ncbi:MAG: hypothetical protein H6531_04450 [Actinobacteria bacterium]|nr:hypothetical protein [Thermoleophilia bacterium]MCB9011066.1 hypothetical protein [Actinomycetota bacterium]
MRQTIAFQATGFDCQPVEVDPEDTEPGTDPDDLPTAVLVFQSGANVVLTVPLSESDAENMMNAFTEAEPHRANVPEVQWEPQPAGLPEGMFWMLSPAVVGIAVTPPQSTPEGVVPHWTLAFDDPEGSQVQVAVGDAMCVQVVRMLAQVAHGELGNDAQNGAEPAE